MTATTQDAPGLDAARELLARTIAESRYEAWDGHARGPFPIPWSKYRQTDPDVAEGVYMEDGRRDADALLPLLQGIGNQAAVKALHDAARELAATGQQDAARLVVDRAARIDWFPNTARVTG